MKGEYSLNSFNTKGSSTWVEQLCSGIRDEARAGPGHEALKPETYPVQGDVGNLETQNDDPEESQDE